MKKQFDMELFLAAVLTGSYATRKRHLRQAKIIRAAIADRWKQETPWCWRRKHLDWFIQYHLAEHSSATKYYYSLTLNLLIRRLDKKWVLGS